MIWSGYGAAAFTQMSPINISTAGRIASGAVSAPASSGINLLTLANAVNARTPSLATLANLKPRSRRRQRC